MKTINNILASANMSNSQKAKAIYSLIAEELGLTIEGLDRRGEEAKVLRSTFRELTKEDAFFSTKSGNDCLCHTLTDMIAGKVAKTPQPKVEKKAKVAQPKAEPKAEPKAKSDTNLKVGDKVEYTSKKSGKVISMEITGMETLTSGATLLECKDASGKVYKFGATKVAKVDAPKAETPKVETPKESPKAEKKSPKEAKAKGKRHANYDEIATLLKESKDLGMGVMLVGPAGTGKTSMCIELAEDFGVEFRYDSTVQTKSELVGFVDGNGNYHASNLYHCMKEGGIYLADELDTWDNDQVVPMMNNIIAQRFFTFPNGETIYASEDFYVMAAANTIGKGADNMYCDRHQLDEATLTRFFLEEVDYDKEVEMEIAKGNKEVVDFIRDLRGAVNEAQLGFAIGYRDLMKLVAIETKVSTLERAVALATLRGMAKDDIKMVARNLKTSNKYAKAFKHLAA